MVEVIGSGVVARDSFFVIFVLYLVMIVQWV